MRKRIALIMVTVSVLLMAGCGASNSAEDSAGADSQMVENTNHTDTEPIALDIDTADTGETSPINETEDICEKTDVNLLEEESESRIIVKRNIKNMEINLTVYLADGISRTIQYPMNTEKDYAYCETAYLQYDNKESIVLEIVNGTSNYGAAEYHVLHVEKENGKFVIIEDATVLGEQPLTGDRYVYSLIGFVGNVSMISAEDLITTIYGKPAVRFVNWDSSKKEGKTYYLYYDQEWKIESVDVLSPLDGVTMEVTECSDTSVTVKITNDTDKDIECGSDFCLKMQDEETGEWRELDEVIDNAAFNTIAYVIQKDSPYEAVIDFEWLYGKLEPGRYRIVKTVTDFRGTGDYTDYTYTAEFSI